MNDNQQERKRIHTVQDDMVNGAAGIEQCIKEQATGVNLDITCQKWVGGTPRKPLGLYSLVVWAGRRREAVTFLAEEILDFPVGVRVVQARERIAELLARFQMSSAAGGQAKVEKDD
ncbi:MAG: hypothetical protein ABIF77_06195 [bacterium]